MTQKKGGWKVVSQKDPYGRWITETIQVDLTKFDILNLTILMTTHVYKLLFPFKSPFNLPQL
jgi:hypothetical protein